MENCGFYEHSRSQAKVKETLCDLHRYQSAPSTTNQLSSLPISSHAETLDAVFGVPGLTACALPQVIKVDKKPGQFQIEYFGFKNSKGHNSGAGAGGEDGQCVGSGGGEDGSAWWLAMKQYGWWV